MRRQIPLLIAFGLVGCATLKTGSKATSYFQGAAALDMRQKEIQAKAAEGLKGKCPLPVGQPPDPGGLLEVTAETDGKLSARPMIWKGSDATSSCLTAEISKITITPLPGPPVTNLIQFGTYTSGTQPDDIGLQKRVADQEGRLKEAMNTICGSLLPPEFGVDIKAAFYIFPGGKVGGLNIIESTAKDGNFEACVAKQLKETKFPDTNFDGPYATQVSYHFGRLEKQ
jgi:hypothetical protein